MICGCYDLQIAPPHPGGLYTGNVLRECILHHIKLSSTNAQLINKPLADPCKGPGGRQRYSAVRQELFRGSWASGLLQIDDTDSRQNQLQTVEWSFGDFAINH